MEVSTKTRSGAQWAACPSSPTCAARSACSPGRAPAPFPRPAVRRPPRRRPRRAVVPVDPDRQLCIDIAVVVLERSPLDSTACWLTRPGVNELHDLDSAWLAGTRMAAGILGRDPLPVLRHHPFRVARPGHGGLTHLEAAPALRAPPGAAGSYQSATGSLPCIRTRYSPVALRNASPLDSPAASRALTCFTHQAAGV